MQITMEQYEALRCSPSPKQLLEFQIETLFAKGLARYEDADRFQRNPPSGLFLLIPPRPEESDLNDLVSLIELKGKKGRNYLDPRYVQDDIKIPDKPYLMLDVKDGKERLNIDPAVSKIHIFQEGRSPYTIWRGIIHTVLFPEVLESHNMDLVGSPDMPFLCLYCGEPRLDSYRYVPYEFPGWGAPSCGNIIV